MGPPTLIKHLLIVLILHFKQRRKPYSDATVTFVIRCASPLSEPCIYCSILISWRPDGSESELITVRFLSLIRYWTHTAPAATIATKTFNLERISGYNESLHITHAMSRNYPLHSQQIGATIPPAVAWRIY